MLLLEYDEGLNNAPDLNVIKQRWEMQPDGVSSNNGTMNSCYETTVDILNIKSIRLVCHGTDIFSDESL